MHSNSRLSISVILLIIFTWARLSNIASLTEYILYQSKYPNLLDPDNIVSENAKQIIQKQINDYKSQFTCFFIIVKEMDQNYWNKATQRKDTTKFTEELAFSFYPEKIYRENSLFILFSINDKVFGFRIGNSANKYVSEERLIANKETIRPYIRSQDYDNAFTKFLINMEKSNDLTYTMTVLLILFIIGIFISGFSLAWPRLKVILILSRRIRMIEIFKAKKINAVAFVKTNCSLCLDTIPDVDNLSDSLSTIQMTSDKQTLDCGHKYHPSCYVEWTQTCLNCPNCTYFNNKVENDNIDSVDKLNIIQSELYRNYVGCYRIACIFGDIMRSRWQKYADTHGYKIVTVQANEPIPQGSFRFDRDAINISGDL